MHLDWWTLALQTVNFAVLVWLLNRFLYAPVLRTIDARRADVKRQQDEAKSVQEKASAELAAVASEHAAIAAEREATLAAAAHQAAQLIEDGRERAKRDAQALLDGARRTLAAEREHVLDEARRLALDLGVEFSRRLLAEVPPGLRAEAWIERIDRYLEQLPASQRDALKGQLTAGESLTVVTAVPLAPDVNAAWRERLRRVLGEQVAVDFSVDADLMAGAELHFPTDVLRFSWRSALAAARSDAGSHGDTH